ncbi:YqhG family protein [Bacillus sp. B-jedd]|uniref:YqhG family protein n=1 Tax=Bacillus sp. B-jedd TaxID=1476857 RepID=UPI0005156085|nr:YqhG family protein [Bacillus sp. B-jedd]CEG27840.1 YqhG [Bacillus sp. B-jedd]
MLQQDIHNFLYRYFKANSCMITDDSEGHLTIQLTAEIDKELMNRPFYWHYLDKTGGVPNPMSVTFVTNKDKAPEGIKGENIHFGSPRLHQIFESSKNLARYIRLYHAHQSGQQTALLPWLCLNVKVSYQCDRKRDVLKSIGLQLINGRIIDNFHERVAKIPLTPKIPDYSYTLSPLIKPGSGFIRIEKYLKSGIEEENHDWAQAAIERWKQDQRLLDHFYENAEEDRAESYNTEKKALQEQYEPKVLISLINGGLFYLKEDAV